ncbi:MAG: EAL domain-containing protein [Rhodococcus sp. (in: high G+C Gram-positive bacteria)]
MQSTNAQISPMSIGISSVYQPIVVLDDRTVMGYEALVRTSGDNPPKAPPELLRAAREQGVTAEFDWRCRASALHGAVQAGYPESLALFVNAEPIALDAPPPRDYLPLIAEASWLSIIVEITERDLMGDPAGLLRAAAHARNMGWRVAIDDVGADSSSLALIPLLRPDVIKLDMALVQGRSTNETAAIVAAVAAEAERTGALVLAEGIETERHERSARDMGAVLGQGYLYGAPAALPYFGVPSDRVRSIDLNAPVTVRAPVAVTPCGLTRPLGARRHADSPLLDAIESSLLLSAFGTGSSTVVLATVDGSTDLSHPRVAMFDELAARTALMAVFDSRPASERHNFRTVVIGEDEPLALERSVVVVAPMSSVALIAFHRGTSDDGTSLYDYWLTYDRDVVLDAATILLRRIPALSGDASGSASQN